MLLSLTACSVIAGALLGWINNITADPIAHANAQILSDAIALVVPGFDNNPTESPEEIEVDGTIYKIYRAMKNGQFIGAAVEASSNGFGGLLTVLVGFDAEGNIIDYSLLNHSETPGLGSKASDWFKKGNKGDIIGKNPGETPLTVINDGGDIDAITASTITSRAFLQAVNNAYSVYMKQEIDASSGASQQVKNEKASLIVTDSIHISFANKGQNK